MVCDEFMGVLFVVFCDICMVLPLYVFDELYGFLIAIISGMISYMLWVLQNYVTATYVL